MGFGGRLAQREGQGLAPTGSIAPLPPRTAVCQAELLPLSERPSRGADGLLPPLNLGAGLGRF